MSFLEVWDIILKIAFYLLGLLTIYFAFNFLRYSFLKGDKIIKGKKHSMGVLIGFIYLFFMLLYLRTFFFQGEAVGFLVFLIMGLGWLLRGHTHFVKGGVVREMCIFRKWEKIEIVTITDEQITIKGKSWPFKDETIVKLDEENIIRLKALILERG
ncbi:hypothetical protein JYU01_01590, partial [bacterium AH-315-L21]|nr:hypothetical protein [bacterium AH-315-L21]